MDAAETCLPAATPCALAFFRGKRGIGNRSLEDGGIYRIAPGSAFVLTTPVRQDLVNLGNESLHGSRLLRGRNVHANRRQRNVATKKKFSIPRIPMVSTPVHATANNF